MFNFRCYYDSGYNEESSDLTSSTNNTNSTQRQQQHHSGIQEPQQRQQPKPRARKQQQQQQHKRRSRRDLKEDEVKDDQDRLEMRQSRLVYFLYFCLFVRENMFNIRYILSGIMFRTLGTWSPRRTRLRM